MDHRVRVAETLAERPLLLLPGSRLAHETQSRPRCLCTPLLRLQDQIPCRYASPARGAHRLSQHQLTRTAQRLILVNTFGSALAPSTPGVLRRPVVGVSPHEPRVQPQVDTRRTAAAARIWRCLTVPASHPPATTQHPDQPPGRLQYSTCAL